MPNAYGLRPVRHRAGGVIRLWDHTIASGYATSIYRGDLVTLNGNGTLTQATTGSVPFGVFDGVSYTNSANEPKWSPFWPGGTVATGIRALVYNDADIVYSVWDDAVADFLTAADVGGSGDIQVGTPDTVFSRSGMMLDTSDVSATSGQLKIVNLFYRTGNDWSTVAGTQCEVEVTINEDFTRGTAGI